MIMEPEFKYATQEQVKLMFNRFFPEYTNDFDDFYKNIKIILL